MPNKNIAWYNRYNEFIDKCKTKNVECLDSEEIYIEKTTKYGYKAKIKLKCLKYNTIVETITIKNFIERGLNCSFSNNRHWYKRYPEFCEKCKIKNVECLDSEEVFIEKTKLNSKNTFIKLKCLICEEEVNTTSVFSFTYGDNLGCKCANSKSENLMTCYVEELFTNNVFIKQHRPNWLKYTTSCNLELDYYCEKLKLAFEYNGIQHYEYTPHFHNNNIENFYEQQKRDKFKEERCREEDIYLIIIPHQYNCYNEEKLYKYIDEKIEEWEIETKQDKILEKGKNPQKKYQQKIIDDSKTRRQKQNKYKSEWNTKPKFCDLCNFWTTNNSWCHHIKTKLHLENVAK